MIGREYFLEYVRRNGGLRETAEKLEIPYSTLAGVCNGSRGIGKSLARRMHEADRRLDPAKLVWAVADRAA